MVSAVDAEDAGDAEEGLFLSTLKAGVSRYANIDMILLQFAACVIALCFQCRVSLESMPRRHQDLSLVVWLKLPVRTAVHYEYYDQAPSFGDMNALNMSTPLCVC